MLRKILIGFAVFLLLLAGTGAYLYFKIRPVMRVWAARSEAERKLLQPRVVTGEGIFERHSFYEDGSLGNISQIRAGWPADREGADIVVVASQGADFVDWTGQIKKQIRFSIQQHAPIAVARMNASGEYGYLTRDESWAVPTTLFDQNGRVVWRSAETSQGVDDSASGDVYEDGKLSVVIGFNGGGGIALLDGQGRTVWKRDDTNVWHVEMLDTNGDGRDEILHSNAKGQLVVRDGNGAVTAQYLPGFYVSHFALTRWGQEATATHILVPTSDSRDGCCKPMLMLLDEKGRKVAELESPMGDLFNRMNAVPIQFGNGAKDFAVLENRLQRSMLLLYGEDGKIVYQEILDEPCLGMAALPRKDGERLLVGGNGKIWEYSPLRPTSN